MIHVAAIAPIKLASASHISKYLPGKKRILHNFHDYAVSST